MTTQDKMDTLIDMGSKLQRRVSELIDTKCDTEMGDEIKAPFVAGVQHAISTIQDEIQQLMVIRDSAKE